MALSMDEMSKGVDHVLYEVILERWSIPHVYQDCEGNTPYFSQFTQVVRKWCTNPRSKIENAKDRVSMICLKNVISKVKRMT